VKQVRLKSGDAQRIRRAVLAYERNARDNVADQATTLFRRLSNPLFAVKVNVSGGDAGSDTTTCSFVYDVSNRAGVLLGEDLAPLADRFENVPYRETPEDSDGIAFYDADGALKLLWADELPDLESCEDGTGGEFVVTLPEDTADNTVIAGSATVTPLTLKGAASQSAPLLDLQDSAGSSLASVNASGQFVSNIATGTAPFSVASTTAVANLNSDKLDGLEGADLIVLAPANGTRNVITAPNGVTNALDIVQGAGGLASTNTLFRVRDSSGVDFIAAYTSDGTAGGFGSGVRFGYSVTLINNKAMQFGEATANGTNKVTLIGPASLSADKTITMPGLTGTMVVATTTSTNTAHAYFSDGTAGGATCRVIATADLPLDSRWTTLVLASNQDKTNNTFSDATTLQLTGLVAGATYEFVGLMVFNNSAGTTTGVKVQIVDNDAILGSGCVAVVNIMSGSAAPRSANGDLTGVVGVTLAAVNNANAVIRGRLNVSSDGQIYIQWAQGTTNANAMTLLAGSYLKYRRLS
jgi:hypothetical protein